METDRDRRAALAAVRGLLAPGGRFIFDVFTPSDEDVAETDGRWLEREPGIWERADWDLENANADPARPRRGWRRRR